MDGVKVSGTHHGDKTQLSEPELIFVDMVAEGSESRYEDEVPTEDLHARSGAGCAGQVDLQVDEGHGESTEAQL